MISQVIAAGLLTSLAWTQTPFRPQIPRTWDEDAMRTLEVPLATPGVSPVHISAGVYYAIPEFTVYKTYPMRDPGGRGDEQYLAWLREQDPEVIAADPAKLTTKADWIRVGQAVFKWPGTIVQRAPASTEGAVIVIRKKGELEYGVLSCSSCHVRRMDDGSEIVGAQMNLPRAWRTAERPTARSLEAFRTGRGPDLTAPWLNPDPNQSPATLSTFINLRTRMPSIAPRFNTSLWSPANMPSLIGVADLHYLDRTGHVRNRGIGDLMRYAALNFGGGGMSSTSSFGAGFPGRPPGAGLRRLSDAHLYALALYIHSLEPPKNPNRLDATAARGRKVFGREGCGGCHPAPLYTNNKLTPASGFSVPAGHGKLYDVMPVSVGTDPWLATKTRRGTGYYKVPSLRGVWYRGPFEHNGSVAALEDWFDPARLSDGYVPTGWLGPESTRAVRGHEFGLKLGPQDKAALIAFLKTL